MSNGKEDIKDRKDLLLLVQLFYERLLNDDRLAYLFAKVSGEHLVEHLDILCDFWESVLFFTGTYQRNAMLKHIELHDDHPLNELHFKLWLGYFNQTVDELFAGEKAELAKQRAHSIAVIMQMKIKDLDQVKGQGH